MGSWLSPVARGWVNGSWVGCSSTFGDVFVARVGLRSRHALVASRLPAGSRCSLRHRRRRPRSARFTHRWGSRARRCSQWCSSPAPHSSCSSAHAARGPMNSWRAQLARTVARRPEALTALAVAFVLAAAVTWTAAAVADQPEAVLLAFRVAVALLATAAAASVADGCEALTTTTPFGRPRLRYVALGIAAVCVAAGWTALVLGVHLVAGDRAVTLPLRGLAIEAAALTLFGCGLASWLAPRLDSQAVAVGAPLGALGVSLVSMAWSRTADLLWTSPSVGGEEWSATHGRWVVVGAASLVWLATTNRDPAGRRRTLTRSAPTPRTAG